MVPLVFLVDNKGIVAWLQVVGELLKAIFKALVDL